MIYGQLWEKRHKYKVGEKVIVREDIPEGDKGDRYCFIYDMGIMRGRIVTIKRQMYESSYNIEEMPYGWEEKWFISIIELPEELFII